MDAEAFELPSDLAGLDDEARTNLYAGISALDPAPLQALLDSTVEAFRERSAANSVDEDHMAQLRAMAAVVAHIRGEQAARTEAATEAAAEIDQLATQVLGEPETPPADGDGGEAGDGAGDADTSGGDNGDPGTDPGGDPGGDSGGGGETPAPPTEAITPEVVPASAAPSGRPRRPALDLSAVRRHQPPVMPPAAPAAPGGELELLAAVDMPGHAPGAVIDLDTVVQGVIRRANGLKSAGGGTGIVASYRLPFTEDMTVTDPGNAPQGTLATITAARQSRLPQGDLVAAGGWCAPSETVYDIADIACPDMLWDAPEIQLARGGIRYFKTPPLDVASLTFLHTEADDIAGEEKACFHIPCPTPSEVRCDAIGICLEAGILTERHFPELVSWYVRNSLVAHEIRVRQVLFQRILTLSATPNTGVLPVTMPASPGAVAPVFAAVALQAADLVERYSLCERIGIEVVFPWWSRNLFLSDLARRNGVSLEDVSAADVQALYAQLGVAIQWARGLPPAVPTNIGNATPATEWPDSLSFAIYPTGTFQIGRGAEVNLGVVHDSAKFTVNDYTAAFSEECVALVNRGPEARVVTVPVCPSGSTGAQELVTCTTES